MPEVIKNVFVSHHHKDDASVNGLTNMLSGKGYQIRNSSIRVNPDNQKRLDQNKVSLVWVYLDHHGALISSSAFKPGFSEGGLSNISSKRLKFSTLKTKTRFSRETSSALRRLT